MTTIQARRRLIVIVLLCIAAVAAVVRHFAVPGTTLRDLSTLLMVLWLPVVGSIVGWAYGKLRRAPAAPAGPPGFAPGSVFAPHALAEITLRPAAVPAEDVPVPPGEHACVVVVQNQGFVARWQVAPDQTVRRGQKRTLPVEFLSPRLALPHLPRDTAFRMLVGEAFVGDGQVVQVLSAPVPATA